MKFICTDMLKYAKRKGYIDKNPYDDVIINTYACKPLVKTTDKSRIYLPNEKQLLFLELNNEINNNPRCTDSYAVFLLFKLGLRIGEIVALKWSDIDMEQKEIHIPTYSYILDNHEKEETAKIIMKALQNMSGMLCSQVYSKQEEK